jgi:alkylation response protein AidB-like acyl-CoA dehydrogenase
MNSALPTTLADAIGASNGSPPSPERLRQWVRAWIAVNLPAEWRDITRGTEEGKAVRIRRAWGAKLAAAGLVAPHWPREYGGAALGIADHVVVLEELVAAGAPEALNSNGIGIFGAVLLRHGTPEQRERYLAPMLDHREIWCQGFSEPSAGSDLASLRTRARVEDDHLVINGQKLWTSFASQASFCYALVRTTTDGPKHAGISMVVIDMGAPGVTTRPLRNIAGGSEFAEVFFDDVVIPRDNVVGPLDEGWRIATEALVFERGLSFSERSLRLTRELRTILALRDEIAERSDIDPVLDERLLDAHIASRALHSLVLRVLHLIDGAEGGTLASLAKLQWSETHQHMLSTAIALLGERAGEPAHQEWLRSLLFSRGETIYGGTSEIQRNLIAKAIGMPGSAPSATRGQTP